MDDDSLIGHTHQELQVLACFTRKELPLAYNTHKLPEFNGKNIHYRPDFVVRIDPVVIVEIDEDGHRAYDIHQEVKRLEILWNAFNKKVIFLRVNVDRKHQLSRDKLIAIYERTISYKDYDVPINKIIVDHIFYPNTDITRYIPFNNVRLLQRKFSVMKEDIVEKKDVVISETYSEITTSSDSDNGD